MCIRDRSDHLPAYRLYQNCRRGRSGSQTVYWRAVWPAVCASDRAEQKKQRKDSGCPRGNPSYRYFSDPDSCKRISAEGSVPSLPVDLETVYCQQNAAGCLRYYLCKGGRRRLPVYSCLLYTSKWKLRKLIWQARWNPVMLR